MTRRLLLIFVAVLAPWRYADAQGRLPDSQRCVDKVFLNEGLTLYGAILGRSADGALTMAVQRDWLQAKSRKLYAEVTAAEDPVTNLETLRDRINDWLQEVSRQKNEPGRSFSLPLEQYLREQLESAEKKLAESKQNGVVPPSQFVIVEIPAKDVRRVYVQPEQNRRVALAAWQLQLKDVEGRSVADLEAELRKRNTDLEEIDPDLSDRLPPRADGEREWAARRAIVEHSFWMGLAFQGTDSYLIETGRERPDLTTLLPKLINQEVTRQLGDLLELPGAAQTRKTDPIEEATKTADKNQVTSIVTTQLDQDLAKHSVSVRTMLLAKMPDGKWERVWSHVVKEDTTKPRKAAEEELAGHAQIKQIRDAVSAFGLPVGDHQLTIAIRFGAATMEAQQKSAAALDAFLKQYTQELDRPPLILGTK